MRIPAGDSEFEVTIWEADGEWHGRIVEYSLSRLTPTIHLWHSWTTRDAVLLGVQRRWQRLFPAEACPDFREAITVPPEPDAV